LGGDPPLGAREVLGVVDSWHSRVPSTASTGQALQLAELLPLTPRLRQALTEQVRGRLPDGVARLAAEVLREPDGMFSCQVGPGADAKAIMWGLMDLLDRVVGTADSDYWTFSTEQSDDFADGLPRFVFLAQWPYSSKQSRHRRLDLTKAPHFADNNHY